MSFTDRWFDPSKPPKAAIAIAIHMFAEVPLGWQKLFYETLNALVAVRTADRAFSLNYLAVEFENHQLEFDMPDPDRVLAGICRRCAQRSKSICQKCGRRGRLRMFNMTDAAVLCPRCAAPELLHRAIDDALTYPGLIAVAGRVESPQRVPEVLRGAFMRATEAGAMDARQFRKWLDELKRLKRMLPPVSVPNEADA
ncbi:hypothetical protein [Roseateles albus]|uniref:Uncharacterized protein n=1 Tax=Roseateles albus TaxID=2987525 RepID=A0ABT5KKF8_9BURK|nr:hypothetical protein [Roseateles albus]MDC8774429.1 hypothetical protein [Roseateles albus]